MMDNVKEREFIFSLSSCIGRTNATISVIRWTLITKLFHIIVRELDVAVHIGAQVTLTV